MPPKALTAACPEKQAFIVLMKDVSVCVWADASLGCLSTCAYGAHKVSVGMIYDCCCVPSPCTGSLYRTKHLYFMCASPSVVSKVFMCLLKSSWNVNETSAVFKSSVWMCLKSTKYCKG